MFISIYEMSLLSSILILTILLTKRFAFYFVRKNIVMQMWKLTLLRLLIPLSFSFKTEMMMLQRSMKPISQVRAQLNINTKVYPMLFGLYCFGVFIMIVVFLNKYIYEYRCLVKRESVDEKQYHWWMEKHHIRKVSVFVTDIVSSPLTYGFFSPAIVLPKTIEWDNKERMEFVLTHEYLHIIHFDNWFKLLLTIALSLHWFNPLVWLMYILANRDIEIACDESVLDRLGHSKKAKYAATLLDMTVSKKNMTKRFSLFSHYALEDRIMAISRSKRRAGFTAVFALVLVIMACTSFFRLSPKIQTDLSESYLIEDLGDEKRSDYTNLNKRETLYENLGLVEDIPNE